MGSKKLLGIYLNDHTAAAVGGIELVRRTMKKNRGTELGDYLQGVEDELIEDQEVLKQMLARLGISQSKAKQGAMWLAEKAGRLKLNGQLTGYSPLSRVYDLEGLQMAVTGRLALLRALRDLGYDSLVSSLDLDRLADRAEAQREQLEKFHRMAVGEAFQPASRQSGKDPAAS
jgi:hypothetical protein